MNLELHIEGAVIPGKDYEVLKKIAEERGKPWEIYLIKPSILHTVKHSKEDAKPVLKNGVPPPKRVYKKMTAGDVVEAIRLLAKGYDQKTVRNKFHVGDDYLRKAIHEHKTNQT